MGQRLSSRVANEERGGSLLGADGPVKVRWDECQFVTIDDWNEQFKLEGTKDYTGNKKDPDPGAACLFIAKLYPYDENDEEDEDAAQFHLWGCGKSTRTVPSEDGMFPEAAPGSSAKGIVSGCGYNVLLHSLMDAGDYDTRLDEDGGAGNLNGMVAIVERQSRTFKSATEGEVKAESLCVNEVIEEPGGGKAGKGKGKKKVAKKTTRAAKEEEPEEEDEGEEAGEFDLDTAIAEIAPEVIGDGVVRTQVMKKVRDLLQTEDWEHYAEHSRDITKALMDPKGKAVKAAGYKLKGTRIEPA